MDSANNPYGLSQAELIWFHGGVGSHQEPLDIKRVKAERNVAKARMEKLQASVHQTGVVATATIDPEFQAGGRFALSEPEQQWAMGGADSAALPLFEQIANARQHFNDLERQLTQLREQHGSELN